MIKAHSLLYSLYICLFVAIFGLVILEYSSVFNRLSLYFQTIENSYVDHNNNLNFLLKNPTGWNKIEHNLSNSNPRITVKTFGVFKNLNVITYTSKDTIQTSAFICENNTNSNALYVANINKTVSYFGNVTIKGNCFLPNKKIQEIYISNQIKNNLSLEGKIENSDFKIPPLNLKVFKAFDDIIIEITKNEHKEDNILSNSFNNETKIIKWLPGKKYILKGNIILYSKEEIILNKNDELNDIIVIAPKISIQENFNGNAQFYALNHLDINKNVILNYPSFVFLNNKENENALLSIANGSYVGGNIILFNNDIQKISNSKCIIQNGTIVLGEIYCTGLLDLKGRVIGSVYTNRFVESFHQAERDNTISDIEINPTLKPKNYFNFSVIENNTVSNYEMVKKTY